MDAPIRVAFLGNAAWSVPALAALADETARIDVVLVVTRHPRPGRRGAGPVPTPVAGLARARGLPLLETATVRSGGGLDRLRAARPDALAVVAYGELLPPAILGLARLGAVNLHFSLLPRWRGAAPVQRAILAGDPTTGVTTMLMDEGLDTGPVLERREEPILPEDDAGSLGERLAGLGARLLVSSVAGLADASLVARPQTGVPSSAPKLTAADRPIAWSDDAASIARRVRALAPEPGATATLAGGTVKVLRAQAVPVTAQPGVVVDDGSAELVVGAAAGSVRILEVAPAGRRRMSGAAFARGAGLAPGDPAG